MLKCCPNGKFFYYCFEQRDYNGDADDFRLLISCHAWSLVFPKVKQIQGQVISGLYPKDLEL
jgi:hypothetical protein